MISVRKDFMETQDINVKHVHVQKPTKNSPRDVMFTKMEMSTVSVRKSTRGLYVIVVRVDFSDTQIRQTVLVSLAIVIWKELYRMNVMKKRGSVIVSLELLEGDAIGVNFRDTCCRTTDANVSIILKLSACKYLIINFSLPVCDKCTLTLMDRVDEIIFQFEISMDGMTLHDLKAPWFRIHQYENESIILDNRFDEYFQASDKVDNFKDTPVDKLASRADHLKKKSNKMTKKVEKRFNESERMKSDTYEILIELRETEGVVRQTIGDLQNYGQQDHHIMLPLALREAGKYLNDVKEKSKLLTSNPINTYCVDDHWNFWSTEWNATHEQKQELERLKNEYAKLSHRLEDMQHNIHKTFRDVMETEALMTFNQKNSEKLQEKIKEVEKIDGEIVEIMDNDLSTETDMIMESIQASMGTIQVQNDDLVALNEDLGNTIEECEEGLNKARQEWLPKAREHSQKLAAKSKLIVDSFQHSKDGAKIALMASHAHSDIAKAVELANQAAEEAYQAAKNSNDKLNPIGEYTISEKGLDSKHESMDIQRDALNEISKIEGKFERFKVLRTKI